LHERILFIFFVIKSSISYAFPTRVGVECREHEHI